MSGHPPESGQDGTPRNLQTALRGLRALSHLMHTPEGIRSSGMARALGVTDATANRLLKTLVAGGYVEQENARGRYCLSAAFRLSCRVAAAACPPGLGSAHAALSRLARATGATALVMVPDEVQRHIFPLVFQHPPSPVKVEASGVGRVPLHASASGKCYLAWLPKRAQEAYIAGGLGAKTEHTLASPEALRRELALIRRRGFASNHQESVVGVTALAVPIMGTRGQAVGALALAYPEAGLSRTRVSIDLGRLRAEAGALSSLLRATRKSP